MAAIGQRSARLRLPAALTTVSAFRALFHIIRLKAFNRKTVNTTISR